MSSINAAIEFATNNKYSVKFSREGPLYCVGFKRKPKDVPRDILYLFCRITSTAFSIADSFENAAAKCLLAMQEHEAQLQLYITTEKRNAEENRKRKCDEFLLAIQSKRSTTKHKAESSTATSLAQDMRQNDDDDNDNEHLENDDAKVQDHDDVD
jgi:hypothetical protein